MEKSCSIQFKAIALVCNFTATAVLLVNWIHIEISTAAYSVTLSRVLFMRKPKIISCFKISVESGSGYYFTKYMSWDSADFCFGNLYTFCR